MTQQKSAGETIIYSETGANCADDEMAVEEPLEIYVDGAPCYVTMRLPGEEVALALGYCFSEGIIDTLDDVLVASYCEASGGNRVEIALDQKRKAAKGAPMRKRSTTAYSSCGICGTEMADLACTRLPVRESSFAAPPSQLAGMLQLVEQQQRVFLETGGTHGAGIFDRKGNLMAFSEDVGRHNALDKCLGELILQRTIGHEMVVALTSRVSFEMAQKTGRSKAQVLLGISAATSLAVELARRINLTLLGFVRDRRGVVYCGPERVVLDGEILRDKVKFIPTRRTGDRRKAGRIDR